jgi:hypothetical protein
MFFQPLVAPNGITQRADKLHKEMENAFDSIVG